MTERLEFPFRFTTAFRIAALPLGIRPETCRVVVDDASLTIHFGPWSLSTPLSNVTSATVTGPYLWPKVIGPPHLSMSDRGITFATNPDQGVCLHFAEPVPGLLPASVLKHPGATVTVEHPAGLAELFADHAMARPQSDLEDVLLEKHDDLGGMTTAQLRTRAKDLGIRGTSSMRKADLVAALQPDLIGVDVTR